jgi:probable HAF family extracellular repeat protein
MKSLRPIFVTTVVFLFALAISISLAARPYPQGAHKIRYIVRDLGTLGGSFAAAGGISNSGWVEGYSLLPGDNDVHEFLRHDGKMTDLGTLPGDIHSVGQVINCEEQVVGRTSDADFNGVGYLWENGVMSDLNTLIPADSPLYIIDANGINNLGQIVGVGITSTGEGHACLLTPIANDPFDARPAARQSVPRSEIALPERYRKPQRPRGNLFVQR